MLNAFNDEFCKDRCRLDSCKNIDDATIINLSDCDLNEIPSRLSETEGLKILDLENNNIKKISDLDDLDDLEYLNLGVNAISKIEGLDNLKRLKTLRLHDNGITKIENLDHLINLEKIDLRNNEIEWIEGLSNQHHLNEIALDGNPLQSVDERKMLERGFEYEEVGIRLRRREIAKNAVNLSFEKEKSLLSRFIEAVKRKMITLVNGK